MYIIDIFQVAIQIRSGIKRDNGIVMAFRLSRHPKRTVSAEQVDIACAAKGSIHFDLILPFYIVFHICICNPC